METAQPRRSYQTLDGLRAIGALLVITRHVPQYFGPIRAPESYLAVDLFYLVSGFVVAHAYGQRLRAGGFFWEFIKTRLIRLYPFYAVGMALGVAVALVSLFSDPHGWWTWTKFWAAVITATFMIPPIPGLPTNGGALDGPTWTLLPELIANAVYAIAIRFMTIPVLIAIMVVCGAGLVFAEFHFGTLDVGYNPTDGWAALARVGYSFFTGVLIFRLMSEKVFKWEWASWACLAVLALALGLTPSDDWAPWYELGVVMVGFPLLVVLATMVEPSAFTGRIFAYLGLISYGVYLIHQPLGHLSNVTVERFVHLPRTWWVLPYSAAFILFVGALAGLLDRYYDAPVRKWLRAAFMPKPKRRRGHRHGRITNARRPIAR